MVLGLAVATRICDGVDGPLSGAPVAFSVAFVFPLPSEHTEGDIISIFLSKSEECSHATSLSVAHRVLLLVF